MDHNVIPDLITLRFHLVAKILWPEVLGLTYNVSKDLFHLNMSTFSMNALILGHYRAGTHISQPIFQSFKKMNSPVHNLLF